MIGSFTCTNTDRHMYKFRGASFSRMRIAGVYTILVVSSHFFHHDFPLSLHLFVSKRDLYRHTKHVLSVVQPRHPLPQAIY